MDDLSIIRAHIERSVTHIAREHAAADDVVWKQMILLSAKKLGVIKLQLYGKKYETSD